jgi:hypothetical protein
MYSVPSQTLAQVNADYGVNLDTYEAITWPLYDNADYTSATTTSLTFFQTPNGQGGKTYADTNMDTAGIIASPNFYFLTGIEVQIIPVITDLPSVGPLADAPAKWLNDVYQMYYTKNFVQLVIGAKKYITEPLNKFPPTHRLDGFAALDTNLTIGAATQSIISYASLMGVPYEINPFLLPPNQPFQFSINWPAAITLASTHNPNIQVTLNGVLYRPAQ